ncbi:hypothetical protein OGH69_13935 [Flavobacterium sp. MFBS3-15]|uniref:hypothetical protein n=1 Tax=Flavobacterium sp. MFBS3-15 TaxID=2989816 RepID=UPI002236B3CA|nr:hypothetical protein [Flavobacterium sp. MFBS3-15]MCW4470072.1 hypothetical protein [Flavobacterium sp. MFBS3-15]
MTDNFKIIHDAFAQAGVDVQTAEYSITEYSLNTGLSFKFGNLAELLLFLGATDSERTEKIKAMVVQANVDPNNFFYVNFYKPKVAEL